MQIHGVPYLSIHYASRFKMRLWWWCAVPLFPPYIVFFCFHLLTEKNKQKNLATSYLPNKYLNCTISGSRPCCVCTKVSIVVPVCIVRIVSIIVTWVGYTILRVIKAENAVSY